MYNKDELKESEVEYLRRLLDDEISKNIVLTNVLFEHFGIIPVETTLPIGGHPPNQVIAKGRLSWAAIQKRLELKHRIDQQTKVSSDPELADRLVNKIRKDQEKLSNQLEAEIGG